MKALARATSGLALVAVFFSTMLPPSLTTANLPCVLTQPPGVRPSGTFEKSAANGSDGATRTRASPTSSPSLIRMRPNCPGGVLSAVNFVAEPAVALSLPLIGGGGGGGCMPGGGGGAPSGGRIPASDHSPFASPSSWPLSLNARTVKSALPPGDSTTSAGNTCKCVAFLPPCTSFDCG